MKAKYQLDDPNNARVFINYKDKKNPIKFEYVGNRHSFTILFITIYTLWFFNGIFLIVAPTIVLLSYLLKDANTLIAIANVLFTFELLFVIPIFVVFIFYHNPKLMRLIPNIWFMMPGSPLYVKTIKPEDIKNNKFEIPLFKNIGLNYVAKKEFSKYLERVEIVEHEFKAFKNRRKQIPQDILWKATFYFSKKPKTGELKIEFK